MFIKSNLKNILYACSILASITFPSERAGALMKEDIENFKSSSSKKMPIETEIEGSNLIGQKKSRPKKPDWDTGNPKGSIPTKKLSLMEYLNNMSPEQKKEALAYKPTFSETEYSFYGIGSSWD